MHRHKDHATLRRNVNAKYNDYVRIVFVPLSSKCCNALCLSVCLSHAESSLVLCSAQDSLFRAEQDAAGETRRLSAGRARNDVHEGNCWCTDPSSHTWLQLSRPTLTVAVTPCGPNCCCEFVVYDSLSHKISNVSTLHVQMLRTYPQQIEPVDFE